MPEIVIPAEDGAATPDVTAPADFGADVIAKFQQRTTTSAAPLEEMGLGQSPYPGGTSVDASDQFAAMAAEINAATAAGEPLVDDTPDPAGPAAGESPTESEVPAAEPVAEEAPAELGGYVWQYLDPSTGAAAAQRYTDAQVQEGIQLKAWAENLPNDVRDALGAVESGQAVAIARADYDRFQAWINQQDRGQRDSDLTKLDVDPDVAKVISDLRDQVAQLSGQTQQQPQQQYTDPNVQARTNQMVQAINNYAQARKLDQQETDHLVNTAVQSGIIGHFQQQRQQVNPVTGQLLVAADPTAVMYEALDYSLYRNPALHAAVVQRTTQPQSLTGQPDQATAPNATVTDITAKRARASSLSAAPSAVVTPSPRTVLQMSDQQRIEGMEGELARVLNG